MTESITPYPSEVKVLHAARQKAARKDDIRFLIETLTRKLQQGEYYKEGFHPTWSGRLNDPGLVEHFAKRGWTLGQSIDTKTETLTIHLVPIKGFVEPAPPEPPKPWFVRTWNFIIG